MERLRLYVSAKGYNIVAEYNRDIAKVKSLLPKKISWSRLLSNITNKRNLRINNLLGYKTNLIVDKFVKLGIKQYKIKGENKTIHADINGSYNIMRKAGVFIDRDEIDFLNKKDIIPLNIKVA